MEKQLAAGQNVVFDVDVVGGCNIKKFYGERALSVFIQPPSVEELRKRLVGRGTDAPEVIESRVAKAEYELGFAPKFDTVIVNDDLETAKAEALKVISQSWTNETTWRSVQPVGTEEEEQPEAEQGFVDY